MGQRIDTDDFCAFVRSQAGRVLHTRTREAAFSAEVAGTNIVYTPHSTNEPRPHDRKTLDRILDRFAETDSYNTSEYQSFTVNSSYTLALIEMYLAHKADQNCALPQEVPSGRTYHEGSVEQILVNRYERDPRARAACIEHHGSKCLVCGFDFGAFYGPEAAGFIHVHHLKPLSAAGEADVDPAADLRPVCPNCHAVIHLGGGCRSIDDVKQMVQKAGSRPLG